jgi:hypothetical protein
MFRWFSVLLLFITISITVHSATPIYQTVTEASLKPGMAIPAPTGPVVLTVSGRIRGGKEISFDMPTLERLGVIRYTTLTSWTKEPAAFDGILLSSLLDVVGADDQATTMVMTALNDFQSSVPITDARTWPVMVAIKENGQYLSRRERGPLWIVYPQHAYPDLGKREYLSRWVWQLASIRIE